MQEVTDPTILDRLNAKRTVTGEIITDFQPVEDFTPVTPARLNQTELTTPWGAKYPHIAAIPPTILGTLEEMRVPLAKYLGEEGRSELKGDFFPTGTTTDPAKLQEIEKELETGERRVSPYESLAGEVGKAIDWAGTPMALKTVGAIAEQVLPKAVTSFFTKPISKLITDSVWYRKMTIPERGLVTQSIDDLIAKGHSEGEILRKWGTPEFRQEALSRRMQGEVPAPEVAPQSPGMPPEVVAQTEVAPKQPIFPWQGVTRQEPFKPVTEPLRLPPGMGIPVYHGSPYRFDKFMNEAIGTGEGAQAFGYGHYVTDDPIVAKQYAQLGLSPRALQEKFGTDVWDAISWYARGDKQEAIRRMDNLIGEQESYIKKYNSPEGTTITDALKKYQDIKQQIINDKIELPQNIYQATIHKGKRPSEYTFLEWEKFIPEDKLKSVKNTVRAYYSEDNPLRQEMMDAIERKSSYIGTESGLTGHGLYRNITSVLGSEKQASEFLKRAGISGIKYPTGSISGMKDIGKYNYVVFNPEDITVTQRGEETIRHNLPVPIENIPKPPVVPLPFESGKPLTPVTDETTLAGLEDVSPNIETVTEPIEGGTWYWGGGEKFDPTKVGTFLSKDKSYAEKFSSHHGGKVHEVTLDASNLNVYPQTFGWQEYQNIFRKDQMFKGYDAVRIIEPNGQGESLAILNPRKISVSPTLQAGAGVSDIGKQPWEMTDSELEKVAIGGRIWSGPSSDAVEKQAEKVKETITGPELDQALGRAYGKSEADIAAFYLWNRRIKKVQKVRDQLAKDVENSHLPKGFRTEFGDMGEVRIYDEQGKEPIAEYIPSEDIGELEPGQEETSPFSHLAFELLSASPKVAKKYGLTQTDWELFRQKPISGKGKTVTPAIKESLGEGKQAWEMTRGEYDKAVDESLGMKVEDFAKQQEAQLKTSGHPISQDVITASMRNHKGIVQQALSEGKPVPPEVLKDYPELGKVTKPKTTEEAYSKGRALTKDEAVATWEEYKRNIAKPMDKDPQKASDIGFDNQLLKETVEGYLGNTGFKSLTAKEIETRLGKSATMGEVTGQKGKGTPTVTTPEMPEGGKVYYHGTDRPFNELDFGTRKSQGIFGKEASKSQIIFLSENKKDAEFFSTWRGTGEPRVIEVPIAPTAKILDLSMVQGNKGYLKSLEELRKIDKDSADSIDEGNSTVQQELEDVAFVNRLKEKGYDGIRFDEAEGHGISVGIFNKNVIPKPSASPTVETPKPVGGEDKDISLNNKGEFYIYRGAEEFGPETEQGTYFSTNPEYAAKYGERKGGEVQRLSITKDKLIDTRNISDEPTRKDFEEFYKKYGIDEVFEFRTGKKERATYAEDIPELLYIAEKNGYEGFIGYEEGSPTVLLTPEAYKKYYNKAIEKFGVEDQWSEHIVPWDYAAESWTKKSLPNPSTPPKGGGVKKNKNKPKPTLPWAF